ncbi:MAG TPA: hypothetical protein VMM79_20740 [Longimicrobiales bacterium]|nr:hypothetical protein [Longimicrobiales bacterium]
MSALADGHEGARIMYGSMRVETSPQPAMDMTSSARKPAIRSTLWGEWNQNRRTNGAAIPAAGRPLAASYARVSTIASAGIEAQHLVNAKRAAKDGYHIPDGQGFRFQDNGTLEQRNFLENLDRLIALAKTGTAPFKRLYITDKTREGRHADLRFARPLQVLFKECGIEVCYGGGDV